MYPIFILSKYSTVLIIVFRATKEWAIMGFAKWSHYRSPRARVWMALEIGSCEPNTFIPPFRHCLPNSVWSTPVSAIYCLSRPGCSASWCTNDLSRCYHIYPQNKIRYIYKQSHWPGACRQDYPHTPKVQLYYCLRNC